MSKVNYRRNGKKYRRSYTYYMNGETIIVFRMRRSGFEVLWKDGTYIPECDISHEHRRMNRRNRHNFSCHRFDFDL